MTEPVNWHFMENEDRLTNQSDTLWECMGEAYYALGGERDDLDPSHTFMFQRAHYMEMNFDINAFESFMDHNEEQDFYGEASIERRVKCELDDLVAATIKDWFLKHGLRKEFRSMETIGPPVYRPWCDLVLAAIGEDTLLQTT